LSKNWRLFSPFLPSPAGEDPPSPNLGAAEPEGSPLGRLISPCVRFLVVSARVPAWQAQKCPSGLPALFCSPFFPYRPLLLERVTNLESEGRALQNLARVSVPLSGTTRQES